MEQNRIDLFLATYAKFFHTDKIIHISEKLKSVEDDKWLVINSLQFKDPTTSLIVSLFGGGLGIDRFIIGDVGIGVGKLLTGGGCGIWTIVDWFLIQDATREKNWEMLQPYLYS
ncbi:MAG: TM2 domain-containing protein [Bacteroidia bacterium]